MGPRAGGYKLQSGQGGLKSFPSHHCRFADILFREHWPGTHSYDAAQERRWESVDQVCHDEMQWHSILFYYSIFVKSSLGFSEFVDRTI